MSSHLPPPIGAKPGVKKPAAKTKPAPAAPAAPKPAAMPTPAVAKKPAAKPAPAPRRGLFSGDPVHVDSVPDEAIAKRKHIRLLNRIAFKSVLIGVLGVMMVFCVPFFQPIYRYYARTPEDVKSPMLALNLPNLTNQAVLAWSASGVTQIMTIGFGDLDVKLLEQKQRFTRDGWKAFVKAFLNEKLDETFRQHQLVLTTVPSDTPVIVSQGENEDHFYEWKVQLPVVMTYATNNNVSRAERTVVNLTIIRVPYAQSDSGIAIDSWVQKHQ